MISFFAIVALGVFYEWLRAFSRRVDRSIARTIAEGKGKGRVSGRLSPAAAEEDEGLLTGRRFPKSSLCVWHFLLGALRTLGC